ncbi:molybdopterin converting factor subunit 1 [Blastochloris viridis]|uniref:Molybdenum cofactor biosynthesis protein MoaD n=1 Tax=Blastochloris viridis TaxID=1079 RepID=A0A0H5BFF8_BLAVI|nr:molybdopterin converting factor subunit 1 [Blastochloris viridis]ALK10223.1 Molybdopterin synthase sulfur carrier subunit [Blastochloris viridis]BAR99844.1 molybdenum cofactor biosynthesis protein MoaD [Blastochloris viridis]CUU42887.1 Sulfur carrier protein moaD [Blastochloris viridis]
MATGGPLKLVYFAWVRERIGTAEETVDLPAAVATVDDLVAWLRTQGAGYTAAFATPSAVRAAIDRVHAKPDAPLAGAREVAFFPPMTGG